MLNEILSEWNIKNETIHAFVTDSASNMMKAFDDVNNLGYAVRISCGAHMLNRAVQQCFGSKDGAISQLFGFYFNSFTFCKIN